MRQVTVSNNRQNAMRPSALRANDEVQLRLSERFRHAHIFYERQEAAFENLRRTNPTLIEEQFENSPQKPLGMEDLAAAIASAGSQHALSVAAKISDLFEDDNQYSKVFAEKKLSSILKLVFLRNLLVAVPLALKDLREVSSALSGMNASRFRFIVTRVLARHIIESEPQLARQYGKVVIGTIGPTNPFRNRLKTLMTHHHTDLQRLLPDTYRDKATGEWSSGTDARLGNDLLQATDTYGIDVFATEID